eukprot:15467096-Alexandrium_andersonii.AAC.1
MSDSANNAQVPKTKPRLWMTENTPIRPWSPPSRAGFRSSAETHMPSAVHEAPEDRSGADA